MSDFGLPNAVQGSIRGARARFSNRVRTDLVVRSAVVLLAAIAGLALFAPVLASGRPFLLHVPASDANRGFLALPEGWTFPWFSALFDRRYHESWLDRMWNAAMFVVPVAFLVGLRIERCAKRAAIALVALAILCWAATIDHSEKSRDYREGIDRLRAKGVDVTALFPVVAFGANEIDSSEGAGPPSRRHPLGTDPVGRDVLARLAFGGRSALSIGLLATALAYLIGIALGALAGYRGGWIDAIVMRIVDVVACVPFFVLLLALIVVARERSFAHLAIALALTTWDDVARLVRSEFLRLRELDFTRAARALGVGGLRIALVHLLPFAWVPLLASAGFSIARGVTIESTLSFLGLADPIVPSWGETMNAGRATMRAHLILVPGILIFSLVSAIHFVADALRQALDTRSER